MADIVRDIYDKSKLQDKVIFQQKKPLLNYELNLAQDILKNRGIDLTQLSIANNYTGDALKVYPPATALNNTFWVRQGTFYHLGRPIQLVQDVKIDSGLTTPVADRTDTVFIEWYLQEIDSTLDSTIKDPVLGFETARQDRLIASIKVSEGSDFPIPTPSTPTVTYNFFPIAKLNRLDGNSLITSDMIVDERDKVVYNFVVWGCLVEDDGGLNVSIAEGDVFVGDSEFYIEDTTPTLSLTPSATSYVYVEKTLGTVIASTTEPTDYHVLLAEVITGASTITSVTDRRKFRPIAWNNKYAPSDEGETGYPTITEKYKAGEDIDKYDVVYISDSKTVSKSSSSSAGKLPCIGISPQSYLTGQIDNIVVFGQIENSAWTWTAGQDVFLGASDGGLTQVAPTLEDTYVQRIGIAVSSKILFINPDRIYIQNKDTEAPLVVMRTDGRLELMGAADKFSPTRLSWLAPLANDPIDRSFVVLPGLYYINDTDLGDFPGATINLGPSQPYQTSAIGTGFYNKAFFTMRDDNTVQMYESTANAVSGFVTDPIIPDNELPICILTFQDNGTGLPGTIWPISQSMIFDVRDWLNMGNLDGTTFKPFYKNNNSFIVQKGSAWFNNSYITLSTNLTVTGDVSTTASYYIYLDYNNATGSVTTTSFVTMTNTPTQVDRRRYIPLGKYDVASGVITKATFTAFKSKFWHYRDSLYTDEQVFITPDPGGQFVFTLTNFTFLSTDFLDVTVNGVQVFEGISNDYVKTAPLTITFNYTVKKNAEVRIRKV